ncbi:MAG: protein translocase subunit SecF [Bacteroidota bacterium]|nr:protein translocase subunit SecF [Bacteroidota bacterium]
MRFLKKTNLNFLSVRKTFYIASLTLLSFGIISLFIKGIDLGIDFLGGTELIVQFQTPAKISDIREALNKEGITRAEIKIYGDPLNILIRTPVHEFGTVVGDNIKTTLGKNFPDNPTTILEEQKIGPKIGAELRRGAIYAILASLIVMLIYIGFRFKFIYGVGAVVALFHDVLITLGIISLLDGMTPFLDFEIDQNMVAAFLTLVGLSVNDSVVIFDRIRENLKIYKTMSLFDVINKSINDTLSRTIITSGTIFMVLFIIMLFGGEVTRGFAFTLTIGIVVGTYSSIYIASAVVYEWSLRKKQS